MEFIDGTNLKRARRSKRAKTICKCGELAIFDMRDLGWLCSSCTTVAMHTPEAMAIKEVLEAMDEMDEYLDDDGQLN